MLEVKKVKDYIFNELCVTCAKRVYVHCEYRAGKREQPDCKDGRLLCKAFNSGAEFAKRWIPVEEDLPGKDDYDKCLWKDAQGNIWYGIARQSQKPTHWKSLECKLNDL